MTPEMHYSIHRTISTDNVRFRDQYTDWNGEDQAITDDFYDLEIELQDGGFEPKPKDDLTWPAKQYDPLTGEWR
jgi:hypothetical protein